MTFDQFFETCTRVAPYGFQRAFALAPSFPDLVEAPTGSGKTATAVLGWLWRRRHGTPVQRAEAGRRLVFCLPMRTFVEQTERAVQTWRERLGLADEELGIHVLMGGAVDDVWEEFPDRDAILIGTQDQLLSRALLRGYAMSRYKWPVHFALLHNDCTWILDEVQLMGVGTSTAAQLQAFRERLGVVGSAKTIWMTATLAEDRLHTVDLGRELSRLPFSASDPALQRRFNAVKRLSVAGATSATLKALLAEIAQAHETGTLTLVIVNRVARAQELAQQLKRDSRIEAVALVHSRFRPADRKRIQDAALSGSFRGVLVATQAIEAGVDISAKTLFTELAPWPSLVQRFGRLNRAGEYETSRAVWIDLDTDDDDACLPYEAEALRAARERVRQLTDVGPATLATVPRDRETPTLPVIRRKDFLELFDTEPDLAGHDIDVSRYIRATDDRDVQLAWRALGDAPPQPDAPDLQRAELCSVPVHALEKLRKNHHVWRFDGLRQRWVKVDRVIPGMAVVVDAAVGGYSEDLGFTRDSGDVPAPVPVDGDPPDSDPADALTFHAADYVSLRVHADDTAEEMTALLASLGALVTESEMVEAARWHDAGKVHPAFQEMLISGLPEGDPRRAGGPWAKSDGRPGHRNARRFFRHELASALAWLAEGRSDLGAYLLAAHHGKVRMSLRSRPGEEPDARGTRFAHGVHEGDALPAADLGAGIVMPAQALSLAYMELGETDRGAPWADRTQRLLEQFGPFKLAYLETMLRVADWRASARRAAPRLTKGRSS
jgi:CRISPR-associated endonuclease/helicase Cas3